VFWTRHRGRDLPGISPKFVGTLARSTPSVFFSFRKQPGRPPFFFCLQGSLDNALLSKHRPPQGPLALSCPPPHSEILGMPLLVLSSPWILTRASLLNRYPPPRFLSGISELLRLAENIVVFFPSTGTI